MSAATPLTSGLVHTVDLIEISPVDSGFGTMAESEAVVAAGVLARFTMLDGLQEDFPQGRGADIVWKVVCHTDIIQDRLLELAATFKIQDKATSIKYRVLRVKSQVDGTGFTHHVSMVVKMEQP